jgi:hypothetical protein
MFLRREPSHITGVYFLFESSLHILHLFLLKPPYNSTRHFLRKEGIKEALDNAATDSPFSSGYTRIYLAG